MRERSYRTRGGAPAEAAGGGSWWSSATSLEAAFVSTSASGPLSLSASGEHGTAVSESRPALKPVPVAGPAYWAGTLPGAMAGKRPAAPSFR